MQEAATVAAARICLWNPGSPFSPPATPNPSARQLSTRTSWTLGVLSCRWNRWTVELSLAAFPPWQFVQLSLNLLWKREGARLPGEEGVGRCQSNWLRCKRTTSDYNFICKCFLRIALSLCGINTKIHSQHTCPHPSPPLSSLPLSALLVGFVSFVLPTGVRIVRLVTAHTSPSPGQTRPAHICQLQWSVEWEVHLLPRLILTPPSALLTPWIVAVMIFFCCPFLFVSVSVAVWVWVCVTVFLLPAAVRGFNTMVGV